MDILYEDKNIISLVKPAGYLCEESDSKPSVVNFIREHKMKNNENKDVFTVHRLDVLTSGVMIFAKNKAYAGKLSAIVGDHNEFLKEYLVIVEGVPKEKNGECRDFLFKDSSKKKSFVVKKMRKGVKEAFLKYELLDVKTVEEKTYSLIKVRLFTGRTHQIRVQFSSRKMPVLGDGKYGSRNSNCNLALFSHKLSFKNPIDKKEITVSALPNFHEYPWHIFEEVEDRL